MYIEKWVIKIFYFLSGLFALVLPCIILMSTGVADIEIKCFAVDSYDRIYVGGAGKIYVYEDGSLKNSFSSQTSRAYLFTIQSDDTIILSKSDVVHIMNLDGKVVDTYADKGEYDSLYTSSNEFVTSKGDVYSLKGQLFWPYIVKNGEEVVYRMPFVSFVVRIVFFSLIICFVVFLVKYVVIPTFAQR